MLSYSTMEKISRLIIILAILIFADSCKTELNEQEFLLKVSNNLSSIKSATYYSTETASAPGDTAKFSEPRTRYIKIFVNPADTLVGSSSGIYAINDTTKMIDFYDGMVRGAINWDEQYVKVDSFQDHPYPFRLVYYPFYTKVKEILDYSLNTNDSIRTNLHDYGDSVRFCLMIYDRHVYFHIKPIVIENQYIPSDEISQFDIWIRKSDNLPYRMRSKWHHATHFESCHEAKLNTTQELGFVASEYYPDVFEIIQFNRERKSKTSDLVGKIAPDWILTDIENDSIRLVDLKSKVILIQFTGLGCGPCHHSIPFIKKLVEDYQHHDFDFVSIETWSNNIDGLKKYYQNNDLNFKFLISEKSVSKAYKVTSVPVFYILDENRVIRKVIHGYSKETVDEDIINTINELLL